MPHPAAGPSRRSKQLSAAFASVRGTFLATGAFSFFINLLMFVGPLYMLQVYDRVLTSRNEMTLIMLTAIALGMLAVFGALELVRSRVLVRIGCQLDRRLKDKVFSGVFANTRNGGGGSAQALRDLDSAAAAPGTVTVESNRKLVQHPDGGVVKRIAVTDGDVVRRNDVLLELDTTESQARFDAVRQSLMAALLRKARLEAERARAEEMQLPEDLQDPASAAEAREIEAAFAAERAQFRERQGSLAGKVAIHKEKVGQLQDRIAGIEAEKASAERQIAIMRDELVGLRELHEKGYYPRTRILEMERELAKLGGQVGSASASIAQARTQIGEARLQIAQVRQQFAEQVSSDLTETQNRISELRQRFVMVAHKLTVSKVRAPQDGVVQNLQVHTIGGVIQPGKEIMEIIPTDDRLVLSVEIKPTDIDVVAQGQDAEVRLTAFSGRTTPSLIGRVTQISADRITQAQGPGVPPRSFYQARVTIPPEELDKLQGRELQAGMPADVLIKTGEQTLLAYLARPITDAMSTGFIEQ